MIIVQLCFIAYALKFKLLIYFKLICEWYEVTVQLVFACGYPIFLKYFVKQIEFFLLTCQKSIDQRCEDLFLGF